MRAADTARLAAESMLRYPLRTVMMLLATSIGVASVLALTSLGEGARRFVTGEFSSLGTNLVIVMPGKTETSGGGLMLLAGETPRDLTLEDAEAVLRSPYVSTVAPVMVGAAPISWGGLEREVPVLGSTRSLLGIRHWNMAIGDFLPKLDMDRAAPVCVLGGVLRREFFGDQSPVGKWMRIGDRRCRVIGVLATEGRSVGIDVGEIVVIPVASGQALFNSPSLFRIIAQARSRETMDKAKADMIRIIKERHYGEEDVTVITQDAVLGTFDTIFNALTMALAGIASISLIVAGVLIMNVMLVAVSQRTEEIGLLKALGAKRRQIIALFLTEAGFLSVTGAVAGVMFGYTAVFILRRVFPALDFTPPLWAVGAAFGVAMVSGLLFGILPARRAARLEPVAALTGQ